ncbi:TadE family protein [Paenarthrobacter sp. S56]|uniref:TadE/TadG family type IV pilus assembly protein n=1 Tax=Paenarthrobacter sp. S56 TaxID=3138179 RepID=UPI0032196FE2
MEQGVSLPNERGSAVVDFVLAGALLTVLFLSVVQLMVVLHVRNTLMDAAGSGARYGTLADRTPADAAGRTQELIRSALGSGFAAEVAVTQTERVGNPAMEVKVVATLPVVGFIGPGRALEVSGHAPMQ